MRMRAWLIWDNVTRIRTERAAMRIVWRMPRWLVKWAIVRAAVEVEPSTNPSSVTADQMLGAFQ